MGLSRSLALRHPPGRISHGAVWSALRRYGFAVAVTAIALMATFGLGFLISGVRMFPVFVAVVAVGLYGGLGPALLSVVVTEVAAGVFVFGVGQPGDGLSATEGVHWALHAMTATMVALLSGNVWRARRRQTLATRAAEDALRAEERAHRDAEASRAAADEERELVERLMAVVSHDVRTPLSAVSMGVRMLRKQAPPEFQDLARRIEESSERIRRMVDTLLDFSLVRAVGGMPVERAPVRVDELCAQAVREAAAAFPGTAFQATLAGECSVTGDAERLLQVVANLLGNAVQHGCDGSPVRLSLERGATDAVLSVHNAGTPIPPDTLPRIFEPFQAAGESPSRHAGLGLYIVREIVAAHGGTVSVTSDEAHGTTFTLRIPHSPAHTATRQQGLA